MKYKFIGTVQDLIDNGFKIYNHIPNTKALRHNIVIDDKNNVLYHQNNIQDLIDKGLVVEV